MALCWRGPLAGGVVGAVLLVEIALAVRLGLVLTGWDERGAVRVGEPAGDHALGPLALALGPDVAGLDPGDRGWTRRCSRSSRRPTSIAGAADLSHAAEGDRRIARRRLLLPLRVVNGGAGATGEAGEDAQVVRPAGLAGSALRQHHHAGRRSDGPWDGHPTAPECVDLLAPGSLHALGGACGLGRTDRAQVDLRRARRHLTACGGRTGGRCGDRCGRPGGAGCTPVSSGRPLITSSRRRRRRQPRRR